MIRLYDRYIFSRWLRAFLITFGVVSLLLLMERMYDDLWDLVNYGASFREGMLYFLWIMPHWVPILMPAAVLVSSLLILIQMHSKREIVALRAAGVRTFKITRSLWAAGILCAGGLFLLNGWVIPSSVDAANLLLRNIEFRAAESAGDKPQDIGTVDQLAFANELGGRLWFFDQFNTRSYTAQGAHIYLTNTERQLIAHTEAREAFFDDSTKTWTFIDGSTLYYGERGETSGMRIETFDTWIPQNFREDPETMLALSRRPKDLSFKALRRLLATEELKSSPALAPFRARMQQVWVSPVMILVVIGLAIPFALRGIRTNPMVGVSQAIFVFFFYYMLINAFTVLGAREVMTAQHSAWAPHGLMALVALFLNIRRV